MLAHEVCTAGHCCLGVFYCLVACLLCVQNVPTNSFPVHPLQLLPISEALAVVCQSLSVNFASYAASGAVILQEAVSLASNLLRHRLCAAQHVLSLSPINHFQYTTQTAGGNTYILCGVSSFPYSLCFFV